MVTKCGEHFAMDTHVESLSRKPETNIIFYVNYISKHEKA